MMTSIITAILPFAIKIIAAWFAKNEEKKEAREAFLKFIEAMQNDSTGSAGLKSSYQQQLERLRQPPEKK